MHMEPVVSAVSNTYWLIRACAEPVLSWRSRRRHCFDRDLLFQAPTSSSTMQSCASHVMPKSNRSLLPTLSTSGKELQLELSVLPQRLLWRCLESLRRVGCPQSRTNPSGWCTGHSIRVRKYPDRPEVWSFDTLLVTSSQADMFHEYGSTRSCSRHYAFLRGSVEVARRLIAFRTCNWGETSSWSEVE